MGAGPTNTEREAMNRKIAILQMDAGQCDLIGGVLAAAGHQCHAFSSSKEMINHLRRESSDMLLLEWQASNSDGSEVLHWTRSNLPPNLPILFISGVALVDDIVDGLNRGANDYLIKPIRKGELAARVQVLLRRAYPNQGTAEQICFGPYAFESNRGRLTVAGAPIDVTQKEFDLALLFFRNLGRPLSRAYILKQSGRTTSKARRAPWTPTFPGCATSCNCVPTVISAGAGL